jgi:streptomycin 6-kinase
MSPTPLMIPRHIRHNVVVWFGADGQAWLDTVPETVARLVKTWRIVTGKPFAGGSGALVLEATREDGTPAVLKVPFLDDENRAEADALEHYAGAGAVRLYERDEPSGALLLERLLPGTGLDSYPDADQAIGIACSLLQRLWMPPPAHHRFGLVRDLALHWAETFAADNARHGRPFPQQMVEDAAALARDLARAGHDVVVNRDAHLANILAAQREPWLLIDPKPLVGERAFDGGYLVLDILGEAPTRPGVDRVLRRLAEELAVDRERLRGWAFLRAIDNGLWAVDVREPAGSHIEKAHSLRV